MGTRGLVGFRKDGIDKLQYQQFDSYPEGVGVEVLLDVSKYSVEHMKDIFDKINLVDGDSIPTKEQIEACAKFTNLGVSQGSTQDWYCLTRGAQGRLEPFLGEGLEYMRDAANFINDSLFCEWAYIVNLDTEEFEVWQGFQHVPDPNNRYGTIADRGYFPCKMIASFSLRAMPDDKTFLNTINEIIGDDE